MRADLAKAPTSQRLGHTESQQPSRESSTQQSNVIEKEYDGASDTSGIEEDSEEDFDDSGAVDDDFDDFDFDV